MINRLNSSLPMMLESLSDPGSRQRIAKQFQRVMADRNGDLSASGVYALIDYVNFKGEGTNPNERYNGQGWGLLQVLDNMSGNSDDAVAEFVLSAQQILDRRISNAPAARNESRWRRGWMTRLDTYKSRVNFSNAGTLLD